MNEIEESIRARDTADLQNAILNGLLIPEAVEIAARVLVERGAEVPTPRTDAEILAEEREVRKDSTRKFLFVVIGIVVWIAYASFTDMFSDVSRMNKSMFAMGLYLFLSLRNWKKKPAQAKAATATPVRRRKKFTFVDAIFLSPVLTRASWSIAIGSLFRIVLLGFALNAAQPQWQAVKTDYDRWQASGKGPACEKLFREGRAELDAFPKCDFPHAAQFMPADAVPKCDVKNDLKYSELVKALKGSGCPHIDGNFYDPTDFPSYYPPPQPESLWSYSRQDRPEDVVGQALIVAAIIFVFTVLGKSFLLVGHKGWQRLMLVASPLTGVIVYTLSYLSDPYRWSGYLFNRSFAAALGMFVTMLYGRRLYLWVREGFQDGKPQQPVAAVAAAGLSSSTSSGPATASIDVAQHLEADDTSRMQLATFWPRFWARCIDLSLTWVLANVVIVFVPDIGSAFPAWIGFMINVGVWIVVMGLSVLVYDTLWLSKTGTTPGKAWFGLAVRNPEGFIPDTYFAFKRSRRFLSTGMLFMLFFPFVQIFAAINASKTLKGGATQLGWDFAGRTFVHQNPVGSVRYFTGAVVAALLIGTLVITSRMAQDDMKKEISEAVMRK